MNELTVLLEATRSAVTSLSKLEDALEAFAERVSLQSTLDTFPSDGSDPGDTLDPTPTVEQLTAILRAASQKIGIEKVRGIVQDEAEGKKVGAMSETERRLVRVALELSGVDTKEFLR
jgi:hypothetical protein